MSAKEQGVSFDRYMLVPRTLIFVFAGKQVLLLRGAPEKRLWAGKYNGIGGHIEMGESVYSAAQREFYEETGLHSSGLHLCGLVTIDTGQNPGVGLFILCGNYPDGGAITPVKSSPEGDLEWLPWAEIHHYPLVPDLVSIFPRVIAFLRGSPPFSAHYYYDQDGKLKIQFDDESN